MMDVEGGCGVVVSPSTLWAAAPARVGECRAAPDIWRNCRRRLGGTPRQFVQRLPFPLRDLQRDGRRTCSRSRWGMCDPLSACTTTLALNSPLAHFVRATA